MPKKDNLQKPASAPKPPPAPNPAPRLHAGKPGRPRKAQEISIETLEAVLRKNAGIALLAANELGITRQTVMDRIERSPLLQRVQKEAKEVLLDHGEGHIAKAIMAGDKTTIRWFQERFGVARGYGNKTQIGIDENQVEAIIASLGGDPAKFREALLRFGVDPDQD